MASEIQFNGPGTGLNCYALIRNRTGAIWNGTAFETYATANYSTYSITATEQGTASNHYAATFPSTIAAGIYSVTAKQRTGGSVAETDTTIAVGDVHWNGSASLPLSDLTTSGQLGQYMPMRVFRGSMVQSFPFQLVSSADHVTPLTSGVISGQISRDGAAFTSLQSGLVIAGYSEIGLGFYSVNLTSGDLLANTIALTFSAVGISGGGADRRSFVFVTQRTSGQTV